jgi:hypothetical protein
MIEVKCADAGSSIVKVATFQPSSITRAAVKM